MGCLLVLVLAGVSTAMIYFFGYPLWVMVALGSLWLAAALYSAIFGHRGFGGGPRTDLLIVIAGAGITAAVIIPQFEAQKPCNQARTALMKLADAENTYFAEHKTYTKDLQLLRLSLKPEVNISIVKSDGQSFIATASHRLCDKDNDGKPDVLMWDSAKGGPQ
ncbi:MAG: hypothetical protein A2X54_10000 [Nitrospirae bacterium GWF2_44_13]|nr:MAG: hypothetical protein A2X54_10000 [Nitrospirae bacterium GWF2_44_13]HBG91932.1 hypothetical protein [Nitrospiraceae bacterium]